MLFLFVCWHEECSWSLGYVAIVCWVVMQYILWVVFYFVSMFTIQALAYKMIKMSIFYCFANLGGHFELVCPVLVIPCLFLF